MIFLGQVTDPLGDLVDCKGEHGHRLKHILKMWKNIKKTLLRFQQQDFT